MAVVEQKNNLKMVPVFADEQDLAMSINTKQVLCASLLKQIDQEYVPFHRFVQQPTITLRSFNTMDSNTTAKMLIPRMSSLPIDSLKQDQEDGNEGTALVLMPLSWSTPYPLQPKHPIQPNQCMNNEIVLWQGEAEPETTTPPQHSTFSYSERKENWIIRRLPRSKPNRWDTYYVHLKTDVQFRSLIDVHTFIIHGILPKRRRVIKKGDDARNNAKINTTQPRKVRGDKLLNRMQVGYYNLMRQEILRSELSPIEDGCSSSMVGNGTKRKREDETSNQGNVNAERIYTLYDFEPIG